MEREKAGHSLWEKGKNEKIAEMSGRKTLWLLEHKGVLSVAEVVVTFVKGIPYVF